MILRRPRIWYVIGLLTMAAVGPAYGQPNIRDMQLFAPAEVSPYGNGPQPPEGFFFTFDGLFWWISTPADAPIGFPNGTREVYIGPEDSDLIIQTNTHDTGLLQTDMTEGNRFEVGRIIDRWGWFVSTYRMTDQTQTYQTSEMDVVFIDDESGPLGLKLLEGLYYDPNTTTEIRRDLPVTFDHVEIENKVQHWSVELNAMCRTRQRHLGGFFEFFAGARYMEFHEDFSVDARGTKLEDNPDRWQIDPETGTWVYGTVETPDGFQTRTLGDSIWSTTAENNIIGPQIGGRWFRQHGRWRLSTEGRFFAGFNNQNIHQRGTFGTDLDQSQGVTVSGRPDRWVSSTDYTNDTYTDEFSPGFEVRSDLHYQITRAISFKVGYSLFWIDNIARPSNMINYEVPTMGINMANNTQSVFIHGLTLGVEVNR